MASLFKLQTDASSNIIKAQRNFKKTPKERLTVSHVETRLEILETLWSSFYNVHRKIIEECKETELEASEYHTRDLYSATENVYIELKSCMKDVLLDLAALKSAKVSEPAVANVTNLKLPKITLPTFSGQYTEWTSFYNLFLSLIHNNEALDEIQKLHYLKSHLSGEAEQLLRHIPITANNYLICWRKLESRYNNKKYLANCILSRFMGQKNISVESSSALKEMLDTSNECLNALKQLGINVKEWDIIVIYILSLKLDSETRKQWELSIGSSSSELPSWDLFQEFLENRFRALEFLNTGNKAQNRNINNSVKAFHVTNTLTCPYCSDSHKIHACKKFSSENIDTRRSFVQNQGLCFNCLGPRHSVIACRVPTRCRLCSRKHHSLLHSNLSNTPIENTDETDESAGAGTVSVVPNQGDTNEVMVGCCSKSQSQILLATALVNIQARSGTNITFRSMLDQGSQASFITESAVQLLGLKKVNYKSNISVLGSDTSPSVVSKYVVYIQLQSLLDPKFVIRIRAHVLEKLTNYLPSKKVAVSLCSEFLKLSLADPSFDVPNKIDLLLSANVYSQVIKEGLLKDPSSHLIAQNTALGWIISGQTDAGEVDSNISCNINVLHVQFDEDSLLKRFWELESEPSTKKMLTEDEQKCEDIYASTTRRDSSGRYIVKLPFKNYSPQCIKGNSKEIAITRLNSLERKLGKDTELKKQYSDVFNEYLNLNHMELVPSNEQEKLEVFYLPHLVVVRHDKITTKVRIVFDASSPNSNGISLNQDLLVGPTIQGDLRHILMRWRIHPICISSDIVKMYRQVLVSSDDVDYQRVLWRGDPTNMSELHHYRLLRVTFGVSSAPYLAIRSLQQLAFDEGVHFPLAAERVLSDFYVDDMISGCENIAEGKELYQEMKQLLSKGGFELQKWISNDEELMEWMRNNDKHAFQQSETEKTRLGDKSDTTTKILGLTWDRRSDSFKYSVQMLPQEISVTKRKVISDISRLYDPLGWLAPIIIKAKIFIQKLWISGLNWDEELTYELLEEWKAFRSELSLLSDFEVPRWMNTSKDDICVELHGFCDASSEAYAAVVYIRVVDKEKNIHVHLVTSKTKVAPIKQISIPRLELCGAALLSKVLKEVSDVLKIAKTQIHAWTDSSVVLAWLSSHPSRWKVFIANRVSEILGNLDRSQWSHVQSKENPADIASRGALPSDISKMKFWKNGPEWLQRHEIKPYDEGIKYHTVVEEKNIKSTCMNINENVTIWQRFSTLRKLVRVVTWCRRFISKARNKADKCPQWLTSKELQETLTVYIKHCQNQHFHEDIKMLLKTGNVAHKSKLKPLNPYLDNQGMLRVGGRLNQATFLSENRKHPVILPAKSHLTSLIMSDTHEKTLHGGPQIMINYFRSKYWIIDSKNQAKNLVRNCIACIRYAAQSREQMMGQLPSARVTPSRPFKKSGVDYAGPIFIRASKGRGHHSYKGYICLFVCMATRAVHLEVVSDLTAKGFISAFKRFVARRGHCAELFSDNGTNFVGAARELKCLLANEKSGIVPDIANWLSCNGTEWHFIPPHTPNFGGLWEAGIKSTKHHLRRVIGTSTLTFEEMTTLLSQIEACLNSRPLTSLSTSLEDQEPLTPGHFLVGEPLILVPDVNYEKTNVSSLKRWQLTQRMLQDFWRRWSQEYLTQFLHRYKWSYQTPEPNIGDIVLVKEDDLPPARWLYGIITEKHPGLDNITRVVTLKCNGTIIKRPVSKLCILPVTK